MKTRSRISCLLLAALMLFAFAACGKDSPEPSPTPKETEQTKPPAQPAAESTIHTPLWDLSYDEAEMKRTAGSTKKMIFMMRKISPRSFW